MTRQDWSQPLPWPLSVMDNGKEFLRLSTLADVRDFLKHMPKERRQFSTWQHVETELEKAAAGADAEQLSIALQMLSIALQMIFQLENVEYQTKEATNARTADMTQQSWLQIERGSVANVRDFHLKILDMFRSHAGASFDLAEELIGARSPDQIMDAWKTFADREVGLINRYTSELSTDDYRKRPK